MAAVVSDIVVVSYVRRVGSGEFAVKQASQGAAGGAFTSKFTSRVLVVTRSDVRVDSGVSVLVRYSPRLRR